MIPGYPDYSIFTKRVPAPDQRTLRESEGQEPRWGHPHLSALDHQLRGLSQVPSAQDAVSPPLELSRMVTPEGENRAARMPPGRLITAATGSLGVPDERRTARSPPSGAWISSVVSAGPWVRANFSVWQGSAGAREPSHPS
jgi:hypothetical protein